LNGSLSDKFPHPGAFWNDFSLRDLGGLCVSAVNLNREKLTTETPRAQRTRRVFFWRQFYESIQSEKSLPVDLGRYNSVFGSPTLSVRSTHGSDITSRTSLYYFFS
jgi:hypothetical protein